MDNNRSYFMRRAAQERSAADHASHEASRSAHLEMAERYRELVGDTQSTVPSEASAA